MLDDNCPKGSHLYRPRTIEELGDPTPVTLINEPVPPDNVRTIVRTALMHQWGGHIAGLSQLDASAMASRKCERRRATLRAQRSVQQLILTVASPARLFPPKVPSSFRAKLCRWIVPDTAGSEMHLRAN